MDDFQGHIVAGTSPLFLVDLFRRLPKEVFVFFLSHFHSDHYSGLGRQWRRGPVWCSTVTGNLIEKILGVPSNMVLRLPMGEPVKVHGIQVTLIDANHCPGAVMFLFEGPGVGRCLHCGDFRYCPSMLQALNPKPSVKSQALARLDRVYLDTTYAGVKTSFPPQEEVLNAALQIALEKAGSKGTIRFLVGTYTIGKERIALHLARKLDMRIFVTHQRRRVFSCLEFPPEDLALFAESPGEAQVDLVPMHVCGSTFPPRGNFAGIRRHLENLGLPQTTKVVGFVGTGWAVGAKNSSVHDENLSIYFLPYSEHSSLSELVDFVKALNPKEVVCPNTHSHALILSSPCEETMRHEMREREKRGRDNGEQEQKPTQMAGLTAKMQQSRSEGSEHKATYRAHGRGQTQVLRQTSITAFFESTSCGKIKSQKRQVNQAELIVLSD
ncbi:DNA ligase 6 [Cyclospora cayetanensis]|uniref:DNA ligase 6 n=1 Tax=Cyclospora cayetanensis TaxID=88456 RepID=A0A6P6S403_9EIME|nr:DNA ligase 6 [Cyclospora cayetanensis]